jgi:ornithine carbamoyltransferase
MHLLNFEDWKPHQITNLINKSIEIKNSPKEHLTALQDKSLAMLFQKTSTRTRVSFEVAMTQLGGHAVFLDWRATNFAIAAIQDETKYLSRNVDCIMARLLKHADLKKMAKSSSVPVINGCCEKYHPTQAIADLMTIKEKKGSLKGTKIVYIGVHNNICNSLIEGCTKLGAQITTVTPIKNKFSIDNKLVKEAHKTGLFKTTLDLQEAMKDVDVVYTDTWVDMQFFLDPKYKTEKEQRIKSMMPYQVNLELLKESNALVMHDMPIHRGYEITEEAINSPNSIIYEQSENRLHSAKAILLTLLKKA